MHFAESDCPICETRCCATAGQYTSGTRRKKKTAGRPNQIQIHNACNGFSCCTRWSFRNGYSVITNTITKISYSVGGETEKGETKILCIVVFKGVITQTTTPHPLRKTRRYTYVYMYKRVFARDTILPKTQLQENSKVVVVNFRKSTKRM